MRGTPDGQMSVRSQRAGRGGPPNLGVDPVPGGGGDHRGVATGLTVPFFEPNLDDFDRVAPEVPPRLSGQGRPGLQRGHQQTTASQRQGRLAGTGADLEDTVAWPQTGDRDQPIEQVLGIVRPRQLIQVSGTIKCRRKVHPVINHQLSLPRQRRPLKQDPRTGLRLSVPVRPSGPMTCVGSRPSCATHAVTDRLPGRQVALHSGALRCPLPSIAGCRRSITIAGEHGGREAPADVEHNGSLWPMSWRCTAPQEPGRARSPELWP